MAPLARPSCEAMTISCRSPELKTHSARKVHPAQKLGERWAPAQAGAKRNAAASSLVFQGKLNGRITVRALKIIAWIAAVILLLVGIAGGRRWSGWGPRLAVARRDTANRQSAAHRTR